MYLLPGMLVVLLVLGLTATLTGRLIVAAVGVPWLRRPTLEAWAFAAVVGTVALSVGVAGPSYLGLPARPAVGVVGVGVLTLIGVVAALGRLRWLAPTRPGRTAAVALGVSALAVTGLALPALVGRSFTLMNDGFTYVCIAEWLQLHGFGTPAALDPGDPVDAAVYCYQVRRLRMGTTFLLTGLRALSPSLRAGEMFLPVMAWGVVLNLAGLLLLCRWSLRLPRSAAAAGGLVAALAFNPFSDGAADGYLPQTYGLPVLAATVALLSRLAAPCRQTGGSAVLLGLTAAGVLVFYSEAGPVLVAVVGAAGCVAGVKAVRRGRGRAFAGFAVRSAGAFALIGNVELLRTAAAVVGQMAVVDGRPVTWTAGEFWGFAVGGRARWVPLGPVVWAATGVLTTLFAVGAWRAVARPRSRPLALALGVFAAMAVAFLFRPDPRTGAGWDAWAEFKVCAWAYPFVLAAQCVGLAVLLRAGPGGRVVVAGLLALAAAGAVPQVGETAAYRAEREQAVTRSTDPLADYRRLHKRIRAIDPANVYLVSDHADVWPRCLAVYLAHPYRFVNGWGDRGGLIPPGTADRGDRIGPGTLFLMWGDPPFEEPLERLPAGMARLHPTRPVIFQADPDAVVAPPTGRPRTARVGSTSTRMFVWSPRAGRAELRFSADHGPGGRLVVRSTAGSEQVVGLHGTDGDDGDRAVPLTLPAGVSWIEWAGGPGEVRIHTPRLVLMDR